MDEKITGKIHPRGGERLHLGGEVSFSVITTVLNEEDTICSLLDSLKQQSLLPKEIIITDAGSTDTTKEKINKWAGKNPKIPVTLIEMAGANRSLGRNRAIEEAKYEYIAVIDAGCEAEEHWLQELGVGFENKETEAVAGFYLTKPLNPWQAVFSLYLATQPDQFKPKTYLPSSRSLALTKNVWERAGKYPEKLNYCEDLVFAQRLKQKTKLTATNKAVVYWRLPGDLGQFFNVVSNYAMGDVEARFMPHLKKIATIFLRYGLFIIWPWLFLFYLIYPQVKFIRRLRLPELLLATPTQITADLAVMWGILKGAINLK